MAFSSPSRKRTAEDSSPQHASSTNNAPVVLHRHHHRRRNIAIDTWGLDNPADPNATASTSYSTTTKNNNTSTSSSPCMTIAQGYNVTTTTAATAASTSSSSTVPSPSTTSHPFNIFPSLLHHPSLFPHFLTSLPLSSLLSLYAISKELHYLFNLYSLSLIHLYARTHYPVSSRVFSAALYPGVCISDPMLRPMDGREWLARDVPGLRWLGMIESRERIVGGILERLEREGVGGFGARRGEVEEALFKVWGLMDMPSTPARLAYLRDREIWTDANILSFHHFLVKLDMRFAHPVTGNGGCSLSHFLLTQQSLSILYNVLIGKVKLDYEKVELLVRRTYWNEDLDTDTYEWLLDADDTMVSEMYWGVMMREGRETGGEKMESVGDMIIEEGVRRELHCQERMLDFVMHGYGDANGRNLPRLSKRGREEKAEKIAGWPSKVEREEAIATLDRQLDLVKIKTGEDEYEEGMDLSM